MVIACMEVQNNGLAVRVEDGIAIRLLHIH